MSRRAPIPAPATRRVAAYVRQSVTRNVEEFGSTKAQEDVLRAWAVTQGTTAVTVLRDDNRSGASLDRPAFQAMMREVRAGKFDVIAVVRLDRLSRSLRDFVGLMEELLQRGVAFVSTSQSFDTSTPLGRMTMSLLAVFSQFERETTSERTLEKIQAARRRGIFTGGNPPMGYDVVDGKLIIDEAAAVIVRDLFAAYLQTGSALKSARLLNERGFRTRRGQPWDKSRVLTALRSPVMCGCINADDDVVEGQHEGIVDRATWDAAQALLDARPDQDHPRSRNPDYLLAGVARCGCGAALTPGSAVARGTVHRYYTCVRRAKRGAEGCPSKGWPAEALEGFVVDRIRSITADGALAEDVAGRLTARIAERRSAAVARRRAIAATADRAEREVARLVDTLADATAEARVEVERRLQEHARVRDDARADAQAIDAELATLEGLRVDVAWVAQTLADFDLVWDHLTPLNRQRLVRALVTEVRVEADAGTMTVALVDLGLEEQRAAS